MKNKSIEEALTYISINKIKILALFSVFLVVIFFVFNKMKNTQDEIIVGIPEMTKSTAEPSTPVNRLIVSPDFVCDEYDRPGKRFSCFSKGKDGIWKPEGKF